MQKLALLLLCASLMAAQQLDPETSRMVNKTVDMTRGWEQLNSQGVSLRLQEVKRTSEGVQYHAFINGAPVGQTYAAISWPINSREPQEVISGITAGKEGILMCDGRSEEHCGSADKKDDPIEFTFLPAKGEIYRLAFVSADGKVKAAATVVPDPIMFASNGCTLEIVRLLPKFELAMIRVKGFMPGEKITGTSRSGNETMDVNLEANAKGEGIAAILPFVKGMPKGKTYLRLKGASCAPAGSFEWGS